MRFDGILDKGPAGDVPSEAYLRFRANERLRKEEHLERRAADRGLHEEHTRVVAEWLAALGSEDQRGRHAAGLLPTEIIDALQTSSPAWATRHGIPGWR